MQLSLFEDTRPLDIDALARCLQAGVVAVDVETNTRYPGTGPHMDYGLSYPADITVIALAWGDGESIDTTAFPVPFDASIRQYLTMLFNSASVLNRP